MKFNQSYFKLKALFTALLIVVSFVGWSCSQSSGSEPITERLAEHPEWTKSANIYEVNIRQYTPEGTFKAFQEELPRLKKMGVDILWLMPIHPIGEKNRKGKLGSYYSVKNYTKVNPRFGTMQDFKELVKAIHKQDMKVILDFVPNHTAWDNPWITEHPEYYMKDSTGHITYEANWTDIAQLNYNKKDIWDPMIDKMKFWVEEANIDGYRMDHAGHDIPLGFWKKAIPEVDKLKDGLFWLAEWNTPEMHPWFDETYAWEYFHLSTSIAKGDTSVSALTRYMAKEDTMFPDHAYRMYFTSNHDENSWNGTGKQLFGDNFENFIVMAATIDGMPLVYGGQETGLHQQLAFFRKDTIDWDGYEYEDLYKTLFDLKDRQQALWNGQYGGDFQHITTKPSSRVYAYKRAKGDSEVLVVLNFSDSSQDITFEGLNPTDYTNTFTDEAVTVGDKPVTLEAHNYLVLEK